MNHELSKYEKVWKHEQYRKVAPGEHSVELFMQIAKPRNTDTVIDFGCGTGRGGFKISQHGPTVRLLDFTDNCLDEEVRKSLNGHVRFENHDLTEKPTDFGKYGYCTDVMEHIPTEDVKNVLKNIVSSARYVFFQISCEPDRLGELIGETLHLTVQPYSWWKERLEELKCNILWSHDAETHCLFYVSAWATGIDIREVAVANTSDEQIKKNVLENLSLNLTETEPHLPQDRELIILAGGPSMNDFEEEIRQKRKDGVGLVTVNGTYNWCLERDIKPSLQLMLDPRLFNKRFLNPVIPECKYLLASQCHPEVVKSMPREQTYLWHSGSHESVVEAMKEHNEKTGVEKNYYPVYGGSTIMLRAFPLLIMLGFSKFHVYGFDSCLMDGKHHGYRQPENDLVGVADITVGDRTFSCHGWMVTQATEFIEMQPMISQHCEMAVYGDGLISHIINTAYKISKELN